jgi:hypothetical protein
MDDVGDGAPDDGVVFFADFDVGEVGVRGAQGASVGMGVEKFDGESAIDPGKDHAAVVGSTGAVDEDEVAVGESGIAHGFSANPGEEGSGGVMDKFGTEVDSAFEVITGGRGKSCGDGRIDVEERGGSGGRVEEK